MGDASSQAARSERVQDAVIALVNAQTWIASRQVMLAQQACLLAPDTDAAFQTLIDRNAANERAVALLSKRRALVASAAQNGIEAAYATLITPQYLDSLNGELNALPDAAPRRVDVGRALLAMPDSFDASRRAEVQIELAKSLLTRSDKSDRSHLDEAIDALNAAAPVLQSEQRMHEWAGARYLTAVARMRRRSDDSGQDLVQAIQCASDAVGVWRGTAQRTGAASALHLLGAAYLERPTGRDSAFSDAADCFREALRTLPPEKGADLRARLHLALADTLLRVKGVLDQPGDDALVHYEAALPWWQNEDGPMGKAIAERIAKLRGERSGRASDAEATLDNLRRAAELRKRDEDPESWAGLQHNLGETYRVRTAGDTASNIESAIEHLSLALEVFTAEASPRDFGLAANSIGAAYLKRVAGDRSGNIERAIGYLEAALAVRPREQYPDYWAKTQLNLGSAFLIRIAGERADNLTHAIEHLSDILQGPSVPSMQAMRPTIELQLAQAFFSRADEAESAGDRAQAGAHAQTVLDVLGPDDRTDQAGIAHRVIGLVLASGPRAVETNERAIVHLEQALAIDAGVDGSWQEAKVHFNLARLYEFRASGDAAENLVRAATQYQLARESYERDGITPGVALSDYWIAAVTRKRTDLPKPQRLADALVRLRAALALYPSSRPDVTRADILLATADTLADLAEGDRGESLKAAIEYYRLALDNLTAEERDRWARAHSGLGVALIDWRGGDRAANLEEAIAHQRAVLDVVAKEDAPGTWALAHHNLGNVYAERIRGGRAQNLEEAIGHFDAALTVFTRGDTPDDWAMVTNSLAGAYQFRPRGDRATNMEQAVRLYEDALGVYTRERFPADWAMTLHNLANVLMERIEGYPPDNIERAIQAYERSLDVRTREALPFYWAMTHVNLGTAYGQRQYGDRAANLRESVSHYRTALEVYTKEASPTNWAWVQTSLGSSKGLGVDEQIACFTAALEVYTKDSSPERWALAHNNLALSWREKARGDRSLAGAAIGHLLQALEVLTPDTLPVACRSARTNLAEEYFLMGDWDSALGWYEQAGAVAEAMLAAAYTEEGRLEESSTTSRLHARAAYCLLRLGHAEEALVRLDAGKTRQLAESLARSDADLSAFPPDLRSRIQSAREVLRDLRAESRIRDEDLPAATFDVRRALADGQLSQFFKGATTSGPGFSTIALDMRDARTALAALGFEVRFDERLRTATETLNAAVREACAIDPSFMKPGITASEIPALVPTGGALVAFILTPAGSAAWVIPSGASRVGPEHVITLPDRVQENVTDLLVEKSGTGGWLDTVLAAPDQIDPDASRDTIESVTRTLWDLVMAPVHERLVAYGLETGPLVLVSDARLALLPLHAAWREVGGAKRSVLDDNAINYAPSLYALNMSRRRAPERTRGRGSLLAVVNPTGDLPFTVAEGDAAAASVQRPAARILPGAAATVDAVIGAVAGTSYIHFATHGLYDWRDPMRSYLALAGGSRLTLGRVVSPEFDLSASYLVVLSACESGFTEFQRAPDEFLGLAAAFMEGGAAGVLTALWSINDLSTALLFEEFYRRHLGGRIDVATALRDAQLWLRSRTAAELRLAERWEALFNASDAHDAYAYRMMRYWRSNPSAVPYASPYYWGAFTYHGV